MTQTTTLQSQFESVGACQDAIKMAKEYKTLEEAWNAWPRGDHMLWIYRRAKNSADAYAAARAEARKKNQQATADICRKYLPLPIL
jgi:hypothetical protein